MSGLGGIYHIRIAGQISLLDFLSLIKFIEAIFGSWCGFPLTGCQKSCVMINGLPFRPNIIISHIQSVQDTLK